MRLRMLTVFIGLFALSFAGLFAGSPAADLQPGTPDLQSAGALAFSPQGILFVGDNAGAAIFAIDVQDHDKATGSEPVQVGQIDQKMAALLGTSADQIRIQDMKVHPVSQKVYFSVTRGRGQDAQPVLLRLHQDKLEEVSLSNVPFAKASIDNAPAAEATDRRGRRLRRETITQLAYLDGWVYVAGLSNEEFASQLRRIPFPFTGKSQNSSLEIYHVAHGRYETHAPVRAFLPFTLGGQPHIVASYTCTPLVSFPISDLKDGQHVKGKTLAELGAGNSPLDMISYQSGGKTYLLVANSSRNMMKIDPEEIVKAQSLTDPLNERFGTRGVPYISIPGSGILQVDNLNDDFVLILQRNSQDGTLNLTSRSNRRL
ncbi:MAG: hypothetical protein V3T83_16385 [Acidobacteriota bacterium]